MADAPARYYVMLRNGVEMRLDPDRPAERPERTLRLEALARSLGAVRVGGATPRYDCWGLVIAGRRGYLWDFKDDEQSSEQAAAVAGDWDGIAESLRMDGYHPISGNVPRPGAVVTYRFALTGKVQHVGVVLDVEGSGIPNVRVLSKWGPYGEYVHPVESVPIDQYGRTHTYWEWKA